MENASKALQIAAGMLIAILILGLIVFVYERVSNLKKAEDAVNLEKTVADFNKQFEIYNKSGLYGTELLSLANKIVDYNQKYSTDDGYKPINIKVTASKITWSGFGENAKFRDNYSSAKVLVDDYDHVSDLIKKIGNQKRLQGTSGKEKTLEQWNKSSVDELKNEGIYANTDFNKYKDLQSLQTEFARKKFNCKKVEYDVNSRITRMNFEEM